MGTPEYKAKYRSLKFNLQKNSALRIDLLCGTVTAAALLRMSSEELASTEQGPVTRDGA